MRLRVVLGTLLFPLVLACAESSVSPLRVDRGAVQSLNVEQLLQRARSRARGVEDRILEIDASTSGFGGFYQDSAGRIVVWVTDSSVEASVLAEVGEIVERSRSRSAPTDYVVRRAAFRFSQLVAFQQLTNEVTADTRLVSFTDADERTNRVVIGLYRADDSTVVLEQLASAGAPAEAFTFETRGDATAATILRDRFRPTGGGILVKTALAGACTLGFNVTRPGSATRYMLYNSHCTASQTGGTGSSVYQKDLTPGDKIGAVAVGFNPNWQNNPEPRCLSALLCTVSDAALVELTLSVSNSAKRLIAPCYPSSDPTQAGSVTYSTLCGGGVYTLVDSVRMNPYVGMVLNKIGMKSGWTIGAVTRTCMDSNFSVFGTSARWVCADEVGAYAEDGDSGAPVFYHDSWLPADKVVPIGLLFAKWTSPYAPYETYFYLTRRELIESVLGTTLEF